MAPKETPKTQKAKPRSAVKASAVTQRPTYAELRQQLAESLEREKAALKELQDRDQQLAESAKELQDCRRQLAEALEQQTATTEMLGIIAARPRTFSRCLDTIVESAARVCGIDDVVLRLHQGNSDDARAQFGPVPYWLALETSVDEPRLSLDARASATLHIHDLAARKNDFPMRGFTPAPAHRVGRSRFVSRGNSLEHCSHVAPKSGRSPQRRSNCSKPSPTRRSSPSRTCGLFNELQRNRSGTTNSNERNPRCHRQLADGYPAGAGYDCRECSASLWDRRRNDSTASKVNTMSLVAHFGIDTTAGPCRDQPWIATTVSAEPFSSGRQSIFQTSWRRTDRFPDSYDLATRGIRTVLATPLLREGSTHRS